MSVRIEAVGNGELALSGDVNTGITLPSNAGDGRFSVAFSDGTLVSGQLRNSGSSCTFEVLVEGAGSVRIEHQAAQEALVLDGRMEWIMVGRDAQIRAADAENARADQLVLGFDNDLRRAA